MKFVNVLLDRIRMLKEDAVAVAAVMEDAFQDRDSVNDDLIDPELRQMFYDLQDMEVLDIRRHEYKEGGQLLRGYEWHIKPEAKVNVPTAPVVSDCIYSDLEENIWKRQPQL